MHDCLSSMHAKTVEAEALLGALGEEFEAVVDSVRAAAPPNETAVRDERDASNDVLMFSRLSGFFKLHERELGPVLYERDILTRRVRLASRPKAAPPLVLLDTEDVKNEIKLWMEYEETLLKEECQILARLPASLENL